jgi:hypothetical protein
MMVQVGMTYTLPPRSQKMVPSRRALIFFLKRESFIDI